MLNLLLAIPSIFLLFSRNLLDLPSPTLSKYVLPYPSLPPLLSHLTLAHKQIKDVGYLWRMLPVPVVCSIDGVCFGGGLQIALGADMRVSSPNSKVTFSFSFSFFFYFFSFLLFQFSIMEAKWGLIPDMSISVTLRVWFCI